jgi:multidrug transporter EmrE-like cation transporter
MTIAVMQFIWLTGAAFLFSFGGLFMYWSDGLRRPLSSLAVFACFSAGAACQAIGMRGSAMSTVYLIVLGLEAITAYLLGGFLLGETLSWQRFGALVLIVLGISWLRIAP